MLDTIAATTDEATRRQQIRELTALRRNAAIARRRADDHLSWRRGRPPESQKKLRQVTVMLDRSGAATLDHEVWADLAADFFGSTWKCRNLAREELISDWLHARRGIGLEVSPEAAFMAFATLRRRSSLDCMQLCPASWSLLVATCPSYAAEVLTQLCRSPHAWKQLEHRGRLRAKKPGKVHATQLRSIMPLSSLVGAIDVIIAKSIHGCLASCEADLGAAFLETAKPRRQVLDAVFPASIAVERGLDARGHVAVAQADVEKYYDNLCPLRIAAWLVSRFSAYIPEAMGIASTFLMLHALPQITLSIGSATAPPLRRTRGVLTGSRSAAAAGRIPPFDVASERSATWTGLGLRLPGLRTGIITYVDNVLALGPTAAAATACIEDFDVGLRRRWGLTLSAESREVLVPRGTAIDPSLTSWTYREHMRVLGHTLSHDSTVSVCVSHTLSALSGIFWSNLRHNLRSASSRSKAMFLKGTLLGLARSRWARWPYRTTLADRLDATQRRYLAILFPTVRLDTDSDQSFFVRRSTHAADRARRIGVWSRIWADDILAWDGHVQRGHDPDLWHKPLLAWQGPSWLEIQRARFSSRGESRTNSRSTVGGVATRWLDGLSHIRAGH